MFNYSVYSRLGNNKIVVQKRVCQNRIKLAVTENALNSQLYIVGWVIIQHDEV